MIWSFRILILSLFYLCSSTYGLCYTISIGHTPQSPKTRTFLIITDLSGSGPDILVSFYDNTGRMISKVSKLLPPNGKIQIWVESDGRKTKNIIVDSPSHQIAGEYWQIYENGRIIVLPLQPSSDEKRYFINSLQSLISSTCMLVISDPSGSGSIIHVEIFNKDGDIIKSLDPITLKPYGVLILELKDHIPPGESGKIFVRSLRGSISLHCRCLYNNNISAFPAPSPYNELLIDKFSTSGRMKSKLLIMDTNNEGPTVRIQLVSEKGLSTLNKILHPNGITTIELSDYAKDIEDGIIKINSSSKVTASYFEKDQHGIYVYPATREFGKILFMGYFLPNNDIQSIIRLLNFGQKATKVELFFYTDDGKKIGGKEIPLKPNRPFEKSMKDYFGNINSGTVIIKCSDASVLAVSNIVSLKNNKHLGKIYAQVIR